VPLIDTVIVCVGVIVSAVGVVSIRRLSHLNAACTSTAVKNVQSPASAISKVFKTPVVVAFTLDLVQNESILDTICK